MCKFSGDVTMPSLFSKEIKNIRTAPRSVKILALLVMLVALHSLLLGIFIYFFTDLFYQLFFHTRVENIFYVRQAGLFLFCLGLFYVSILSNIKQRHPLITVLIATKFLAVVFLISNARFTSVPTMILLAAVGDGSMALLLALLYRKALPALKTS
jgi:hypothetical protein